MTFEKFNQKIENLRKTVKEKMRIYNRALKSEN